MKQLIWMVLALFFCSTAFAETEETGPVELMGYIGKPYAELMEFIGEPRNEQEAFQQGIQYYRVDDGYTVYLKDMQFVARGTIDYYPDYGWDPDTTFVICITDDLADEYMLAGIRTDEYFPDVESRLLADGWTQLTKHNMYSNFFYEKTIGDVRYELELLREVAYYEDNYDHITCVSLTGYTNAQKSVP